MKYFGITITDKSPRKRNLKYMSIPFVVIISICFIFFALSANIGSILFSKNKVDVFKEDLGQIAFYFQPIDKQLASFFTTVDDISQGYMKGENIFQTKSGEINTCRNYVVDHKDYLKRMGFANYDQVIDVLVDLKKYQKDFFALMGNNKPYNYLIILENVNEKRPNGWFFWSFAFLTIDQWHIKNLEIVDSYYPDFIAYQTRIMAPSWTSVFLPDRKIGFIAGNKFGFTDIDGKNLKDLYELMFNKTYEMWKVEKTMQPDLYNKLLWQDIKGVIFLRSDLLEKIFPNFKQKERERQFLNASVDLIRKEVRGNKKEMYIKEIKAYFDAQKVNMIKNVINRFDEIANKQYLTFYFSNISTGFESVLQKHNLTNTFNTGNIYFRDTNTSYNKIDSFVSKQIQIVDGKGLIVKDSNSDIVNIQDLAKGNYTIKVSYNFSIPDYYPTFIQSLEKKYAIQITDREKAILGLKSWMYEEPGQGKIRKRRESKSTIYFPQNIKILNVTGDMYYQAPFYPPFANGLFYQIGSIQNDSQRGIKIEVKIE